ncbi:carbohydrate ABC transporter permease [Spiroplasma alleghenense]|uniref:Arabinogalactan oligomer / maltooligosaccharide transport system permease protein n=1 Tax=Spiroplasma alleghenense TaxID=216931 RepID=A0A345Z300_9MOLU|nr:sugar ABC transporter permease [Spiroplasma alleghenense]AXK50979.1 arabinogalactan oligomer / maltooligosaccharide transport system permease protein [Spiroplasma alleghenense]
MTSAKIEQIKKFQKSDLQALSKDASIKANVKVLKDDYNGFKRNLKDERKFKLAEFSVARNLERKLYYFFDNIFHKENVEKNKSKMDYYKNKRQELIVDYGYKPTKEKIKIKKETHKLNIAQVKNKYKSSQKQRVEDNLLIAANGNWYENEFSNLPITQIKVFKQEYRLKKTEFKNYRQSIEFKELDKNEKKLKYLEQKVELSEIEKKFSYDGYLNQAFAENEIDFLKIYWEKKDAYEKKLKLSIEKYLNLRDNVNSSSKQEQKKVLTELKKQYCEDKKSNFISMIKRQTNYKAYQTKKTDIKNKYLSDKKTIIFSNKVLLAKWEIKKIKNDFKQDFNHDKLILVSKNADATSKIPVQQSKWKKYLACTLGLILPGSGQIYNGQYVKGLIMYALTAIMALLVAYAFGFGNIEGNGIIGLITLGNSEYFWSNGDARYFVIEGALGVLFLSFAITYAIISARESFLVARAKQDGARVKSWLETKNYFKDEGYPIATSIPAFLLVMFIIFVPIISTILLAFTNYGPNNVSNFEWVGWEQFRTVFNGDWTNTMVSVLGWTAIWTVFNASAAFFLAFILASLVNNQRIKGKVFFRLIYILPWAIPGFISILLFKVMFMPGSILSNIFGNDNFQTTPFYAKVSLLMIQTWMGYCVNFVLITGILQSIPKDLYEAAEIDGASSLKKTWKVTIPLIIFQMTPILIGQFIGAFNNFSIIYLYLDGGPYDVNSTLFGGAGTTDTVASLIFKLIQGGEVAKASVLNIVVSGVIVAISVGVLIKSKSVKGGTA